MCIMNRTPRASYSRMVHIQVAIEAILRTSAGLTFRLDLCKDLSEIGRYLAEMLIPFKKKLHKEKLEIYRILRAA